MAGVSSMNKYPFEVALNATKQDVKEAVEEIFSVHVRQVRTMTRRGKPRRYKFWKGTTGPWKRAVVTLTPGETIEFI